MTYSLTVKSGQTNVVLPDGQRRAAGDVAAIPDRLFGTITAAAKTAFLSVAPVFLGGSVSHMVTIAVGKRDVVLPNGRRCQAGDVVVLSDDEYSTITAAAKAALFSADTTTLT